MPSAVTAARPQRGCWPAGAACSGAELVVTVPPTPGPQGPDRLRSPDVGVPVHTATAGVRFARARSPSDLARNDPSIGGPRRGDPVEHVNGGPPGRNRQDRFQGTFTDVSRHESITTARDSGRFGDKV